MKTVIQISESKLKNIIKESINKFLNEECLSGNPGFYDEEDSEGKTGKPGQVRSYELGYNSNIGQWQEDADENGLTLEEYVEEWFDEVNDGTMQFTWQTLGGGYGYNGDTITTFKNKLTGGEVVVKDIWEDLMIDEYAPKLNK